MEIVWPLVSEENLREMIECFVEIRKRRGLNVSMGKSKVMVLKGEERSACKALVDGRELEKGSRYEY